MPVLTDDAHEPRLRAPDGHARPALRACGVCGLWISSYLPGRSRREKDYSEADAPPLRARFGRMDARGKELITRNSGSRACPAREESFTLEQFQRELDRYKDVRPRRCARTSWRSCARWLPWPTRRCGAGDPSRRSSVPDPRSAPHSLHRIRLSEIGRGGPQPFERAVPLHGFSSECRPRTTCRE